METSGAHVHVHDARWANKINFVKREDRKL